jgi:cobalt-zinc-cadmium efflux system protein
VLRPASDRFTWGFRRAEVLAALGQAAILLAVGIYAFIEGVSRLFEPPEISPAGLLVFGIVGLVGNVASMLVLSAGLNANLNMRAAFLEVLNDALGSVAVIVSAIVIATTGWAQIDALAAMLISLLIVPRTVILLRETGLILLESTPRGLDLAEVRNRLLAVRHVVDVHDLHASMIASGLPVLTAHVIVEPECFRDGHASEILADLQRCVADSFPVSVEHSTFQIEPVTHRATESETHS